MSGGAKKFRQFSRASHVRWVVINWNFYLAIRRGSTFVIEVFAKKLEHSDWSTNRETFRTQLSGFNSANPFSGILYY